MVQQETMYQRLAKLNRKISEVSPGAFVRANSTFRFEWYLISPEGKVILTRDSLGAIENIVKEGRIWQQR